MLNRAMAAAAPSGRPNDLTTLEDFLNLMAATKRCPTLRTVQRWVKLDRLNTWPDLTDPKGQRILASTSDLLVAHKRRQSE